MTEFRLLGPMELTVSGERVDLGAAKQRCVLAVLLLAGSAGVSTESLADRVWGSDPPAQLRNVLYTYIARLRVALEGTGLRIVRAGGRYVLAVPAEQVDVLHAQAIVERAQAAHGAARAALLEQALDLWRGEPLADITGAWADQVRADAWRRRLRVLAEWAELRLDEGMAESVVARFEPVLADHPFAETLNAEYVRALARAGRVADAQEHYRVVRERLADELGVGPGIALQKAATELDRGTDELSAISTRSARLPAVPAGWHERDSRIDQLIGMLDTTPELSPAILLITGAEGAGKTALAIAFAQQITARYPDAQLFVNLVADGAAMSALQALRILLGALDVPAADIPTEPNSAAGMYRSLLAGQRVLVVLDDAESAEQVRPMLPGRPGSVVLVTSRDGLSDLVVSEGAQRLRL